MNDQIYIFIYLKKIFYIEGLENYISSQFTVKRISRVKLKRYFRRLNVGIDKIEKTIIIHIWH